ncbi:ABC transporter transmembrane region 2-domain-containing protein [Suillus fuscotomentosus]|uniref:ABC transporter transmembrane region 2-domain-containing protein n=1 Tax=Suillus fuscotomentosus TaxID=1912939 RepID=A0AAD4HD50_9AGAM|nr:ABC transporter transmembrane region 2-domain-containing protein [Suillus fuscotomentosus]KAG1893220.1 ABC transporter transmembrane region 2-domain-containing protein [Suillus fuscotomentosus]
MAIFSKPLNPNELFRHQSSRRPLLVLIAQFSFFGLDCLNPLGTRQAVHQRTVNASLPSRCFTFRCTPTHAHSTFLVLRTVLSIAVARLDGRIVRDLNPLDSIHHDLYLSSAPYLRYYRVPLHGIDQYITADVDAWAESVAGIYGNLMKPSLDLLLFTSQLARSLGFRGTILRAVTPAFGRLAAVEARLEGEYRAGESEEVAFYDGGARERDILTRTYLRLIKHVNSIYKIRIAYEWTEDFVIKYLWSAAGYGLIAVPLLITRKRSRDAGVVDGKGKSGEGKRGRNKKSDADGIVAARTETYISNRRLLLSLADAGGRLMYAYKDLQEVAGLTGRLYTLLSTLHNLPPLPLALSGDGDTFALKDVDICIPEDPLTSPNSPSPTPSHSLATTSKLQAHAEPIPPAPSLEATSSETLSGPNTTLVRALTLTLRPGMHLMITGSNGVGENGRCTGSMCTDGTVARPVYDALTHPTNDADGRPGVFVIPQRPYHPTGSLLSQIIYPHSVSEFTASPAALSELESLLDAAHLGYLVDREGGWGAIKEWRDVLSGGEKQRLAMARLYYHRPKFAILDECTSAVSSDVEGQMYEHAKALGITLITISLRPSLTKYHTHILTLTGDGTGSWTFSRIATPRAHEGRGENRLTTPLGESEPIAGDGERELTTEDTGAKYLARVLEEIRVLEARIEESCEWEKRVRELGEELK